MAVRRKGTIKNWNTEKGFGFISPNTGEKDVFLHITSLQQKSRTPEIGESIVYTLSKDKQNRLCAIDATFNGEKLRSKNKKSGLLSVVIATVFLMCISALVFVGKLPPPVLWLYMAASLITLITYWKDKYAARKGDWRTPESTLHFMALIGGWPGASIAQFILRHKSKKTSFRAVFFITVILNISGLVWLLRPESSAVLSEWLHFYLKV